MIQPIIYTDAVKAKKDSFLQSLVVTDNKNYAGYNTV